MNINKADRLPVQEPDTHRVSIAALFLIIAVTLSYSNSFKGVFIFDDIPSIIENTSIRNLWELGNILRPPPNIAGRPLINFTLAINYAISGEKVWSYHLFNLLIHILATLTLFGIIRRTLLSEKLYETYGAVSLEIAFAGAILWGLHPLQTQAVTYIIQRCESFMGLFLLLTLYCAIRGWQSAIPKEWHLASVLACLIGVVSKEGIVIAPFLVLAYDLFFIHHDLKEALQNSRQLYRGLFLCLILLSIFILIVISGTASKGRENIASPFQYMLTQSEVIFHYIRLAILPYSLTLDYQWEIAKPMNVIPYLFGIIVLIGWTVWATRNKKLYGFALLWFFATLAPSSSIIPIKDIAFEHRMYLPLAGLSILAVIGVYEAGERLSKYLHKPDLNPRIPAYLLLISVVVILGSLTFLRNQDYQSEITIWQDNVSKAPDNSRAHDNLGKALLEKGKEAEAIFHFQEALRIKPDNASAHANLGAILFQNGDIQKAMSHFQKALKADSGNAVAHANMGVVLASIGKQKQAISHFKEALQIKPNNVKVCLNLINALLDLGKEREAIYYLQEVLYLQPDNPTAHYNLGNILLGTGKFQDAIWHFQQSLSVQPENAGANANIGAALVRLGNSKAAIPYFRRALQITPNDADILNSLGVALAYTNNLEEAIGCFQKALEITPEHADALKNLKSLK